MVVRITKSKLEEFRNTLLPYKRYETFRFVSREFDVVKALYIIDKEKISSQVLDREEIEKLANTLGLTYERGSNRISVFAYCNDSFLDSNEIDLTKPIISLEIGAGKGKNKIYTYILIDGIHRLRKAYLERVDSLSIVYLDRTFEKRISIR